MTTVIDASLTIAAFAQERDTAAAQAVMAGISVSETWVPLLWRLEVANVLRTMVKRKRIELASVDQILEALSSFPIQVDFETDGHAWGAILALSREENLTPYDAAYLELAIRREAKLATLDIELAAAARRRGIEVLPR